ncbi:MAG TPA: hypothetical protein VNY73_05185, partial [Bacteroidia bacterium]|nr:hypothetical protein [Bacteroidia bacterium]
IDLMQSNATEQYIYLSEENRSKLPLYVQSFAGEKEKEYYRLSVTRWVLHETNTRQVLGVNHLMQLNNSLNLVYGAQALVALPTEKPGAIAAR